MERRNYGRRPMHGGRNFGNRNHPGNRDGHQQNFRYPPRQPQENRGNWQIEDRENDTSGTNLSRAMQKFEMLVDLADKDPNEIILTIISKSSGLYGLIHHNKIHRNTMAYILILLGKACKSNLRNNVIAMVNYVTTVGDFFLLKIQQYFVTFQKYQYDNEEYHMESLVYFIDFLEYFQRSQPASASENLPILIPLLKSTCEKYFKSPKVTTPDLLEKIDEIQKDNDHFLDQHKPGEVKRASEKERLQVQEPPESYRIIPTLPTENDIQNPCPFLRPNIVQGKYQDCEHYLDIQFRLLREDYVRPLRDGIIAYQNLKKSGKNPRLSRDVKIYQDVHVIKQELFNGRLVHIVQFNVKEFSKVRWEYSKRFLSGSLLCLSSDDFKTLFFASVARRSVEELKKGLLLLHFEESNDRVLNISPLQSFVIIETDAYFEAYRYNLNALHQLNEDLMPMKRYIIDVEKQVQQPEYLTLNTRYDFRPLLLPLNSSSMNHTITNEMWYDFPDTVNTKLRDVCILNSNEWPTAEDMSFDPSQYAALKAAITKEFAVIQGPPGTGKTYVGLRIVQLLLHNVVKWQHGGNTQSPILVVCYTNHALDQFLEGVLTFSNRIVRIGGRGSNEAVSQYQLNNLKWKIRSKREIPNYIFSNIMNKTNEVKDLKRDVDHIRRSIENSHKVIISETFLQDQMGRSYESLKNAAKKYNLTDDGNIIKDWLGARIQVQIKNLFEKEIYEVNNEPEYDEEPGEDDDVASDGEGDVEYLEAQRNIDDDFYEGFKVEIDDDDDDDNAEELYLEDKDGWQMQGGNKARKKYIAHNLQSKDTMTEQEAARVRDIWRLNMPDRWRLYRYWLTKYVNAKQEESLAMQQQLQTHYEELREMQTEEDLYVLRDAHVVGMTTTGAAKYRNILQQLNPRILIVEEAAEILESHIVTSMARDTQHVILIGDHQQLRPSPTVHALAVQYDLNISLFERMINNGMERYQLQLQHRMRPDIASLLVPHIYKNLDNHESVLNYEDIKGVRKNLFFISHSYAELQEDDSKSKVNKHEAEFLIRFCKYLILQGYKPSQITILATYSGQLFALKKLARGIIENVRITVVDNFQGEENDIILVSFVRSNEEGYIGFLKISNRICVALSRAKKALYCIGNFELLSEKSDLWKSITGTLREKAAIGTALQLVCQNHPNKVTAVVTEKHFDAVSEGGCNQPCEYRLDCGHTCSLLCHPYNKDHAGIRCMKWCTKQCSYGHQCRKKCYLECGECDTVIEKQLSPCNHVVKVACYQQNSFITCKSPCSKFLSCGHHCRNLCIQHCTVECKEIVIVNSQICGHEVKVPCYQSKHLLALASRCNHPCRSLLECEHKCKGTCGRCLQGRIHVPCNEICNRVLVCGHECKYPCSKSCPPCKMKCENRCRHSKCPKSCGVPCEKCIEPCDRMCPHKNCTKRCGELCDRPPCEFPCPKKLRCKHPCIGLCGEPCPQLCRICNREEVTEVFFGTEDEKDARFIVLDDCKHLVEVTGLTEWVNATDDKVQLKTCPKCKTPIRKSLRFANAIKQSLLAIENVKMKAFGDKKTNEVKQHELLRLVESRNFLYRYEFDRICSALVSCIQSKTIRNIQELTSMENIINIAFEFIPATRDLSNYIGTIILAHPDLATMLQTLQAFISVTQSWLTTFIQNEYLLASEQSLQEVTWEVHRLKLINKTVEFASKHFAHSHNKKLLPYFIILVNQLSQYKPFRKPDVDQFVAMFKEMHRLSGSAVINVSDVEKQSILKAMGLSQGHWYQCPNGHVYCITECGGATQEGICNECHATIGGGSHRLRSDNRVASAMDGAQHSAWGQAQELDNYEHFLIDD